MMQKDALAEALAQLAEVRAALDEQREITARQEAALNALRDEVHQQRLAVTPPAAGEQAHAAERSAKTGAKRGTSRRGLLRGAAAGAAAAAVAAVAVGGTEQAHAASEATGGNFVLGSDNTADMDTILLSTATDVALSVWAVNTTGIGTGIHAISSSGPALVAESTTQRDIIAKGTGRILQLPQGTAGAPTSGTYSSGESIRDANGDLWLCVAGDYTSVGTWVKVAHLAPGATNGGAITFLSQPMRLLDSRPGFSAYYTPGAKLTPGDHLFAVNGATYNTVTIPASATGVIGNITTINAVGPGFLSVVPANTGFTGTSNLVFEPGQIIANAFTSGVGASLQITNLDGIGIDVFVNANPVDVIIDLFAVIA